ncbi:hypothetical protein [Burkholderia pseudomallei]|uniref:hypothetical protein n=1 Tax=Burkholderia pseudomallei TaxID=28450 RepID=UPI00050FE59C|nr:hypothetical protein [Burkholderia pseudomallei]KGC58718.1 hypothetical protein DP56_1342 [Burkholderia pseudomallei]
MSRQTAPALAPIDDKALLKILNSFDPARLALNPFTVSCDVRALGYKAGSSRIARLLTEQAAAKKAAKKTAAKKTAKASA